MILGAAASCASCNAGFDNSRIRSLDIEARRHYDEGERLARELRTDEAIASFTRSIGAGPSAEAYNGRAAAYIRQGRNDEAIADANRAIMMSGNYALPYFTRGNARYARGEYDRAMKDYSRSLILDPDQPHCYFNLAQAYTRMGLRDEAIDMYRKAVEADPGYAAAHYNRACLYAQKNEAESALGSLELAVRAGLCDPGLLDRERSFDALRKSPRFKKLQAEMNRRIRSSRGCEKSIVE